MNPITALFAIAIYFATLGDEPPRHEVCPGATYFYSGKPPVWAHSKRVLCRIGRHVFLTDKRNPS